MRVAWKSIAGVETVEVSLNKGLATATLKAGNAVRLRELEEAIAKNGFSAKGSNVMAAGEVVLADGKVKLRIPENEEAFEMLADAKQAPPAGNLKRWLGKRVMVSGRIPESRKEGPPPAIYFSSITEVRQ